MKYNSFSGQITEQNVSPMQDISYSNSSEFNQLQLEQILIGQKEQIDVSQYANPSYSYETMKQIRLSLNNSYNLKPFLEMGFVDTELEEIRLAIEEHLPIELWITKGMYSQQIHEIRMGLSANIDVTAYAKNEYNWMQMEEIRLGLEKGFDVSIYSNSSYSNLQMREIRLGLEADIDVSSYAKLLYSKADMKEKRQKLIKEKNEKPKENINKRRDIKVWIEENGNKAYVTLSQIYGSKIKEQDIYDELANRGIVYGIDKKAITSLVRNKGKREKVLVAEGYPAENGKDGWFEFFVRIDLPRIPAPLEDGSVDYVNIEAFEMVEVGEKLAVYHPAKEGRNGKNVFGEDISALKGTEKPALNGKGFRIDSDGVTYTAQLSGKFEFIDNTIIISNLIVVREDVTAVSGKIEVDGSVCVIGSVHSGGYIKATGDIIVEQNMEQGELIAGGNVLIKRGSCSKNDCYITAKGEVSGKFFEAAHIEAEGNVRANYIMHSHISTLGKVIVAGTKGRVLGGNICAVMGVDTHDVGNNYGIKTVLEAGKNRLYVEKKEEFRKKREKVMNEITVFKEKMEHIQLNNLEVPEEISKKLTSTINLKKQELKEIESEELQFTEMASHVAIYVRGTAYAGNVFYLDNIEYVMPREIDKIILRIRNGMIKMFQI